jgi:hypothetical protein
MERARAFFDGGAVGGGKDRVEETMAFVAAARKESVSG